MKRATTFLVLFLCASLLHADDPTLREDVVYGHKDGMALTFDVFSPAKPSGAAVLWLQSGGWYSNYTPPAALRPIAKGFTDKGYTLLIVRHGSAPKYTVPEAIDDVRRAVRFVRLKASDLGVDPERLGVTGGSAGGHLTLMLAATGDDGDPNAKDEVLKQSSRIAAAVALYPPTDLRGWVNDPPAAIKRIPALKPPLSFDAAKEEACSPLLFASSKTAPSLMIHGDRDELVPIKHSQEMVAALEKAQGLGKLVTIDGAGHSFTPKQNETVGKEMMSWFEEHLAKRELKNEK